MFNKEYLLAEPLILRSEEGIYYRDNSDDLSIIEEFSKGAWSDIDINANDAVLDLGAHIGLSSRRFLQKSNDVLAVEADPRAAKLIKLNAPNALIRQGLVSSGEGEGTFYLSSSPSWRQSSNPEDGSLPVTLPKISYTKIVQGRTVIKCDIEGGERNLPWDKTPSSVRLIGIELHNYRDNKDFIKDFFNIMGTLGFKSRVSTVTKPSRDEDRVFILKRAGSL